MSQKVKYFIKVVLCGEAAVGKTSLRRKWMGKGFSSSYLPTLGADFAVYSTEYNNQSVEVQIWDLAGQPTFELLRKRFFIGVTAALLVFDLTREDTLLKLSKWILELQESNPGQKIPVLFIGNKNDLKDKRTVNSSLIEEFVKKIENNPQYNVEIIGSIETSAKTGEHVDEAFKTIINHALESQFLKNNVNAR